VNGKIASIQRKFCYKPFINLQQREKTATNLTKICTIERKKMHYTNAKNHSWICNKGKKDMLQTLQEFAQYKGKNGLYEEQCCYKPSMDLQQWKKRFATNLPRICTI
jgi:hypothetical protein